ncbi:ANTAR domain-containing protein [Amycolatopsis sp. FDAARGOS 1241]|uniref:ANTAR domain-containing protein n=1 Tax=Amycolatopsis sp. FDAARGOS 1241 TaxID=2778070 RepID=UPI0019509821|nr:ANTAR domain-containing protein [Amycolatopsis sp. FDAARGOS 1241]QRP50044.1 ANTAR domain-containing protein [Amycolatopsis sp. FDAARGOS 1241]
MTTELQVAARSTKRAVVLRLQGELVAGQADDTVVRQAVAAVPPPGLVVFDLREVELLSAAAIRLLVGVLETLRSRAARCRLVVAPDSAPEKVLRAVTLPAGSAVFAAFEQAVGEPLRYDEPTHDPAAPDPGDPEERLASLTRLLAAEPTVGGLLRRVVSATRVVVPGADLVSVTLRDPARGFSTPVETAAEATELDLVQYRIGEGPCFDAARPGGPGFVVSADLAAETRWPRFAAVATYHGLTAVLATDLLPAAGPQSLGGALNVYSRWMRGWRAVDRQAVVLLSAYASLALDGIRVTDPVDLATLDLSQPIAARDVLGRAQLFLTSRQGMDAERAATVLRRAAGNLDLKLVALARTLVERPGEPG